MEEILNRFIDALVTYRCHTDVFISKNIDVPKGFNTKGFNFIPKENIEGVVCFSNGFPFTSMDMDIQDILDAHIEIQKYTKKAHSVVFKDAFGSDLYFKFKSLDNIGMPEIIR